MDSLHLKVFFLTVRAQPLEDSKGLENIAGAYGLFFCKSYDMKSVIGNAEYSLSKFGFDLVEVCDGPYECNEEVFKDDEIIWPYFSEARDSGEALLLSAWTKDGTSFEKPIRLERTHQSDAQQMIQGLKRARNKGRCLHYNSGKRCEKFIEAHSIQKSKALASVARSGEVYAPTKNFGDMGLNNLESKFTLQGIKNVSTFRGFCRHHDNLLFRPIDDFPFQNSLEQASLYHYRTICREYFHKENAVNVEKSELRKFTGTEKESQLLKLKLFGSELGLNNLRYHKAKIEECLQKKNFKKVNYVLFKEKCLPVIAFSGCLFPDFDFLGNKLQDLSNVYNCPDLLSHSFVPTDDGWGFMFCWHESSNTTCQKFLGSLFHAEQINNNRGDLLFNFVVSASENFGISPSWWESLDAWKKEHFVKKFLIATDPFIGIPHDYISNIPKLDVGWNFDSYEIS